MSTSDQFARRILENAAFTSRSSEVSLGKVLDVCRQVGHNLQGISSTQSENAISGLLALSDEQMEAGDELRAVMMRAVAEAWKSKMRR
jgi:hypothetical protein